MTETVHVSMEATVEDQAAEVAQERGEIHMTGLEQTRIGETITERFIRIFLSYRTIQSLCGYQQRIALDSTIALDSPHLIS